MFGVGLQRTAGSVNTWLPYHSGNLQNYIAGHKFVEVEFYLYTASGSDAYIDNIVLYTPT